MEQYEIPKEVAYENIRTCLANFQPCRIKVRLMGSSGGDTLVDENLEDKTLDIQKSNGDLSILIGGTGVFLYKFSNDEEKNLSLSYDRGGEVRLPTGIDPNDENLPQVNESILRGCNGEHLLEIHFRGKIPLKFHSYRYPGKEFFKYWYVDTCQAPEK